MCLFKASSWFKGRNTLFGTSTKHQQTLRVYTETSEKPHTSLSRNRWVSTKSVKLLHHAGNRNKTFHH